MKASFLHITNGDSTTNYLQKLKFKGEIITWREMLCEGKTTTDVGSEHFWKNRFDFLKTSYKTTKKTFIDYTLKEYRNLCNQKQQDEIILWFEHDLFCQINMLAVISWLKRYRKGRKISLVCSGKIEGSNKLHGLGELSENQLQEHYKNRVTLSLDDIEYADYIWQLYCSDSPLRLEAIYAFNPMSPFIYLKDALQAHLQRFPSIENGLNSIENTIINTSNKNTLTSKNQLINTLLNEQEVFGFGDIQYERKIDSLKKLFTSFNPVKLSKIGQQVLENQKNYYADLRSDTSYLGGARKYSFLHHNATGKLLQITS
ncbi:uncharacterized protein DUF1835 [Lutibacter sp. Hel_I_33_5]|uniref:DUF1835 domain-containing protein n=1 Tax=Lutibacter sp. Hel_I_33_5 TaxID=1566289 RepID=UPI0011A923EC|nr:DUF1835 domain-containing protein [Lutibacter sp. Hel_I_33_5]TVZ54775.1 uncharacterized protein DUF1835 [Lutibacter sp. Hel_I_33_5]